MVGLGMGRPAMPVIGYLSSAYRELCCRGPGYLVKPGPLSIVETRSMRAELALFGVPGLRRLSGLGCGFAMAFL